MALSQAPLNDDEVEASRLLAAHERALFAYSLAIVRDRTLAEDVVQEVALTLLRRWSEFVPVRDFWRLAREIARRQSLAALRRTRKQRLLSEAALDALDRGFDALGDDAERRVRALDQCVERLPERWRAIVRMRYWEARAVTEIAKSLDCSANTISVTLNRVRARLADCVATQLAVVEVDP
jgi:RNA polymerase sigma-70 factor (ECF subfamily)